MVNWENVFGYMIIGAFLLIFAFLGNVLIGDPLGLVPYSPYIEAWHCVSMDWEQKVEINDSNTVWDKSITCTKWIKVRELKGES